MTMQDDSENSATDGPGGAATRELAKPGLSSSRGVIWTTGIFAGAWAAANLYYVLTGEPVADTPYLPGLVAGVISWIVLSQWTCRVADARRREGLALPRNAWIWFAWFIPIANLFSPAKTLWKLGRDRLSMSLLLVWWLPWLVANQPTFRLDTGGDPGWLMLETIAIVVSWLALLTIIRRISDDSVI